MGSSYIRQHLYASSGPKRTELFPVVAGKTGEQICFANLAKLEAVMGGGKLPVMFMRI